MFPDQSMALELKKVRFGFSGRPTFLGPVDVSIRRGQCWAIVGPNGAGKSTLLRLMAGLFRPGSGTVTWNGRPLRDMTSGRRGRRIAFLPQHLPTDLDQSVRDVVLMGRFPHRSMGLFESAEDFRIAEQAMETTAMLDRADRSMATLSGGEAQRAHLAASLAQQPDVWLLDEPTASLDIHHQLAIFHILRSRAVRDGRAVVVVTHDVNLAARFCSRVLLLDKGRVAASGKPTEVISPAVLTPVYGVEMTTLVTADQPKTRWVVPTEEVYR